MSKELLALLDKAKRAEMTPEEQEGQRRSFAYGNTKFENDAITRETIDLAAKKLEAGEDPGQ